MIAALVLVLSASVLAYRERHHRRLHEQARIDLFAAREEAKVAARRAEEAAPLHAKAADMIATARRIQATADERLQRQAEYQHRLRSMLEQALLRAALPPDEAQTVVANARYLLGTPPA